jgi:hypothetical protein
MHDRVLRVVALGAQCHFSLALKDGCVGVMASKTDFSRYQNGYKETSSSMCVQMPFADLPCCRHSEVFCSISHVGSVSFLASRSLQAS